MRGGQDTTNEGTRQGESGEKELAHRGLVAVKAYDGDSACFW